MMIAPAALGFFEDFDDGLAQGMGDSDFGWPPGMVPIDGSDPLANPVRNYIRDHNLTLPLDPSPGSGDWGSWSAGENGAVRTSGGEEAWVLAPLGFGTYTTEYTYEQFSSPNPCEKRLNIVLFGSHPTQNTTNTLQSGVLIQPGTAGDWGLVVRGILPTDPDDILWSLSWPVNQGTYRPFYDGGIDIVERHKLDIKLELLAPGTLSMWWKAHIQPTYTQVFSGLDVSSYLIEWSGDPGSGFVPVGPATSGYWGWNSGDAGYHLADNVSFVPIPEPTLGLLGLIALVIRRKK